MSKGTHAILNLKSVPPLTRFPLHWKKNQSLDFVTCALLKKNLAFSGNSSPSFKSTASPTSHLVSKSKFQISQSKSWNSKSKRRLNDKLWHWSNKIGQAQWPLSKNLSENNLLGGWLLEVTPAKDKILSLENAGEWISMSFIL